MRSMCDSPQTNLIAWLMYNDLCPTPHILRPSAGSVKELHVWWALFLATTTNEKRILGFLYPCPHKAKFLLFSSTHNRSKKFRITKFPTAQACLYLKYTTIKCLVYVYFKYKPLMFFSTVSDSYLIVRNPIFTDNYGNTKEKINFSECINHFKSARLAFLQYQKRRGQNVYK